MKLRYATLATASVALAIPFFAMVAPIAQAQNIPAVGKPTVVGSFCPYCTAYFDTPNGKMPSACPHCHRSFVQREKPAPTQAKPKLKAIDPFGDFLFYDVPIRPDNGKLQTRHFDPDGLAAKAEAWGKEMKQVDEQSRKKKEAQDRAFEHDKETLSSRAAGSAPPKLKNIYAEKDEVPGTTVSLLRGPDAGGEPLEPKSLSERPIGSLSDAELLRRSAEVEKKIQQLVVAARHDLDTSLREQKVWSGVESDLEQGESELWKATRDVGIWAGLSAMDRGRTEKIAKDASGLYALYQNVPELKQSAEKADLAKGIAATGDLALEFLPSTPAAYYNLSKFGINYTAALCTLGINGNMIGQFDAQNQKRLADGYLRQAKLKKLEEDKKQLEAEKALRENR